MAGTRKKKIALAAAAVLAVAGGAFLWSRPPVPEPVQTPAEAEKAVEPGPEAGEIEALLPFLEKGILSRVEESGSQGARPIEVIGLVRATPDRVWEILTDYGSYREFTPKVVESEVLERDGTKVRVRYRIEAPIRNIQYTLLYAEDPEKRTILVRSLDGDVSGAFHWTVHSVREATQAVISYRGVAKVAPTSWIMRWVLENEPEIEEMVNLSSMTILIRGIRDRAEADQR
ncbi:MAG: SRPBCC family protein [Planctomycetes bacterium]|nr:SRPBCC family protein [Planctomycetota bacterium]